MLVRAGRSSNLLAGSFTIRYERQVVNAMPLKKGSSSGVKSSNIKKLIEEGRPRKQAIAIAYSESRRSARKKKKT